MKITPISSPIKPAFARRAQQSESAAPADSVLLSSPAPSSKLPAAPGLWGALFGPHGPALAESVAMAERVAGQGLEFRRMGKFLWWNTGWKEASPKQAAKLALAGKADRLQVKKPGQNWNGVRGRGDLERLDAFYGHPGQSQPAGDQALLALEKKGLLSEHGAFGAWSALTSGNRVRVGELTLDGGEQACLAAYLLAGGSSQGLQHPQRAEMLGWMGQQGLKLAPLQAYGSGQTGSTLAGVALPEVTLDDQGRQTLEHHLARHQTLASKLGEGATAAWQALYADGSKRDYAEREGAAITIFSAGLEHPTPVYTAVLASAGQQGDLQKLAGQAAQLANSAEGLKLWQAVSGPKGVEPQAFQLALVSGLEPAQAYTQLIQARLSPPEFASLQQLAAGGKTFSPDTRWAATDGGWTHSPGGNYHDHENCSLTSPTFTADDHTELSFRLSGSTENGPDKLSLEVSSPSGTRAVWSMTGPTSGWQNERVDLSQYAGQKISLNFRFTSDHSVQGPGYTLDSLAVRDAKGQALVHGEPAKLDRVELFKLWLQPENRAE
ncbi:MAG: choice-of-anchor J domain-containing protein, partial [Candidatus Eremiobacteraeota bacterium]|nr:choice-of-anchor J domain-containing protein [Candidatus Eremiobacteraeota bacterium]